MWIETDDFSHVVGQGAGRLAQATAQSIGRDQSNHRITVVGFQMFTPVPGPGNRQGIRFCFGDVDALALYLDE